MPRKYYLLVIALMPLLLWAQEHPYTLTAKIGKVGSPAMVYMAYKKDGKRTVDSTSVNDGVFTFKGTLGDPFYATLVLDYTGKGFQQLDPRGKNDMLKLYVDKGITRLTSIDSVCHAIIEGSSLNSDYQKLQDMLKPVTDKVARDQLRKSFIENNPHSYISLLTLWDYSSGASNADTLEMLFRSLPESIQQTAAGRDFVKMYEGLRTVKAGMPAPEFEQTDTNGSKVSLSSFRGKYVLIDFWASWCGPCRVENPQLVRLYEKFKAKNFTILGVSLDQSDGRQAWLDAIRKDGLAWQQVSDLKGWDTEARKLYGVSTIPDNFLVGPDGKIVAMRLSTPDLEKLLEKLLTP